MCVRRPAGGTRMGAGGADLQYLVVGHQQSDSDAWINVINVWKGETNEDHHEY